MFCAYIHIYDEGTPARVPQYTIAYQFDNRIIHITVDNILCSLFFCFVPVGAGDRWVGAYAIPLIVPLDGFDESVYSFTIDKTNRLP